MHLIACTCDLFSTLSRKWC